MTYSNVYVIFKQIYQNKLKPFQMSLKPYILNLLSSYLIP